MGVNPVRCVWGAGRRHFAERVHDVGHGPMTVPDRLPVLIGALCDRIGATAHHKDIDRSIGPAMSKRQAVRRFEERHPTVRTVRALQPLDCGLGIVL